MNTYFNLNEKNLLTSEDVCRLLRISVRTLCTYRRLRILPFSQSGRKIYYQISDIQEYLTKHYVKADFQKQEGGVL
jgi:hypothetical protein